MTSDILGVSISGLRVSQNALRTTGHNIANANTEGYSRQQTEINSLGSTRNGVGYLGSGAYTNNVARVVNEFVTAQTRQDTTLYSELNAYNTNILQLNDVLSNEVTGLTQGLQSFFSAVQTVSDDPSSIATRQVFISEASNLSDRFNTLSARVDTINDGVNEAIEVAIESINGLVVSIANLNNSIAQFSGASSNQPNDLLDQRDEALKELAKLVSVNVSVQDDNQVNVTVGNGISLVLGSISSSVALGQNEFDPSKPEIRLSAESGSEIVTSSFSGGEIGGLLDFQKTVIDTTYNDIGRVALSIAENINGLQQQGITLNNTFGSQLFTDINTDAAAAGRIFASSHNADNTNRLSVNITDTSSITTSDYMLSVEANAGVYRVTRLSDNTELLSNLVPTVFPASIEFDGLTLTFDEVNFSGDEQFLIQPTRTAAQDLSTTTLEAEDLALASPLSTNTHLGNLGTAVISAGEVTSLFDASGNALPLFAQEGAMSPPLLVKFTTANTYDILDNSDPGNPVQLSPPIRNQVYVPGVQNQLFPSDNGQTTVQSQGAILGLPTGSTQATQAAVKPSSTAPAFAAIDFSTSANTFSFDVVVSNTLSATHDGTFTVNIDAASISSNTELLAAINDDLASTNITAYITDTAQGSALAFSSNDHGTADITLQNYNADPDGGTDNAPAGQANTLLGFDIEGSTFTTVANANGISGIGSTGNNYPVETMTIVSTDPVTAITTSQNIFTTENASARTTANALSNIDGVSAQAFNYLEFRSPALTVSEPLQLSLNGESLIAYDGAVVSDSVPSTTLNNGEDFNDYLADTINTNDNLQAQGIYAVSAYDASTSEFYVQLHSTLGDDFTVELTAAATGGGSIDVSDGENSAVSLTGSGTHTSSQVTIGGRIDVSLSENLSLSTNPTTSAIFGDSSGANFSRAAYLGIQANITGSPVAGDVFSLDFNNDPELDNRNALLMSGLQQLQVIDGDSQSFQEAYNQLVETIGIKASTSQNSTSAAESVLEQTVNLRNSISGVNLDEEAADLIRFEQLYSANAQVITVARDLFDRLLSSF